MDSDILSQWLDCIRCFRVYQWRPKNSLQNCFLACLFDWRRRQLGKSPYPHTKHVPHTIICYLYMAFEQFHLKVLLLPYRRLSHKRMEFPANIKMAIIWSDVTDLLDCHSIRYVHDKYLWSRFPPDFRLPSGRQLDACSSRGTNRWFCQRPTDGLLYT